MQEVSEECEELNIGFHLLAGEPTDVLSPAFLKQHHIGLVVTDFSPLRSVKYFHSDQGTSQCVDIRTPPLPAAVKGMYRYPDFVSLLKSFGYRVVPVLKFKNL